MHPLGDRLQLREGRHPLVTALFSRGCFYANVMELSLSDIFDRETLLTEIPTTTGQRKIALCVAVPVRRGLSAIPYTFYPPYPGHPLV